MRSAGSAQRDEQPDGDSTYAGEGPAASAGSDSLGRLLTGIDAELAPVRAWRVHAEAVLRADSATPRADSVFLRLRSALEATVRDVTAAYHEPGFQALIWPDGAAADYRRRTQPTGAARDEPLENAVADSVTAFLAVRGIRSTRAEGSTYFMPSDADLLRWVGRFLTPQLQAFLRFSARDQAVPIADDAALMVTPDELAERILGAERMLDAFPDSPVRQTMLFWYYQYLAAYLGGLPNTPAFDWRTRELRPHFRSSHEQFLSAHAATAAGRVVADYIDLLERSGYVRSSAIDAFLQERWDSVRAHVRPSS